MFDEHEQDARASSGESYHAIQDFYSHSNYVELYERMYGQTNVKDIPTYGDAMSNKKYAKFAELLKSELRTGESRQRFRILQRNES